MAPHNGRQVHTPSCRRRCGCRTRLALTVLLAACCTRLVSAAGNGTKARGRVGEAPVLVLDDGPRNRTQGPSVRGPSARPHASIGPHLLAAAG